MIDLQTKSLALQTKGFTDIIDITAELQGILDNSDFEEGSILVFVPGSTAGLTTIEFESGLIKDLKEKYSKLIEEKEKLIQKIFENEKIRGEFELL